MRMVTAAMCYCVVALTFGMGMKAVATATATTASRCSEQVHSFWTVRTSEQRYVKQELGRREYH